MRLVCDSILLSLPTSMAAGDKRLEDRPVSHATHHRDTSTSDQPVRMHLVQTPPASAPENLSAFDRVGELVSRAEAIAGRWLAAHSIRLLRLSLGAVFLTFGALKFFPGVSPAEELVKATTHALTLGLVPGSVALVAVAALECIVGVLLLSGRYVRVAIYLLGFLFVGILSPAVLFAPRLFGGPHHAPTLEGQYVLKDVVLVAATLVVAATLRSDRISTKPSRV